MMFWQVCQCWNSIETKRLDSKKTHVKARIHPNPSVCTSIYWIRHVFVWRSQICHGTFEIYWCQRWKLGSPNLLLSTCAGHVRNGIVHHLVDKTTAHRGKFDFEQKKQSKRLHRKDPLNLRCFEDDSMTDVRMRMCSSFLHEGGERIAKARIMYQDVSRRSFLRPCLKADILALAITIQPKHQVWTSFGLAVGVCWHNFWRKGSQHVNMNWCTVTFQAMMFQASLCLKMLGHPVRKTCCTNFIQLPIEWHTHSW